MPCSTVSTARADELAVDPIDGDVVADPVGADQHPASALLAAREIDQRALCPIHPPTRRGDLDKAAAGREIARRSRACPATQPSRARQAPAVGSAAGRVVDAGLTRV